MKPSKDLLTELRRSIGKNECWQRVIAGFDGAGRKGSSALHLAILVEPYLTYILEGRKTIESRFSVNRIAPYAHLRQGDVIILKQSSGPILGTCRVARVWFYRLEPNSWREIRHRFAKGLCADDPGFWAARRRASFATLMQLEDVKRMEPLTLRKRDRRGWVVLAQHCEDLRLL